MSSSEDSWFLPIHDERLDQGVGETASLQELLASLHDRPGSHLEQLKRPATRCVDARHAPFVRSFLFDARSPDCSVLAPRARSSCVGSV